MPQRESEADQLAHDLYQARLQLQQAGLTLHDQAGPLLSAAGIQLQLLSLDHPQTAPAIRETLAALDQATESIRALSQQLNPSPAAHIGLERALAQLALDHAPTIALSYTATSKPPPGPAVAIYETILLMLHRAWQTAPAAPVRVSVRGPGGRLAVRMLWKDSVNYPRSEVAVLARRLRPAGIVLDVITEESTIVSILYATRRSARR